MQNSFLKISVKKKNFRQKESTLIERVGTSEIEIKTLRNSRGEKKRNNLRSLDNPFLRKQSHDQRETDIRKLNTELIIALYYFLIGA